MRACGEYEIWISAFLDGELSGEERAELMAHMASCRSCQQYFDDLVAIHDALDREEAPLPEGFGEQVMARVRETEQEKPPKARPSTRWRQWTALAACCALVMLGLWGFRSARGDRAAQDIAMASMPYMAADDAGVPAAEDEKEESLQRAANDEAPIPQPEPQEAAKSVPELSQAAPAPSAGAAAVLEDADADATANGGTEPAGGDDRQDILSLEDARDKALALAGTAAGDALFTKEKLDWDDGRQVYEFEFYAGDYKYDCELDAGTGALLSSEQEDTRAAAASGSITREQAQELALAQVPGAAAEHIVKLELDRDDGRTVYEIEIVCNAMEYELELSAADGTVLKFESEPICG